MVHCRGSYQGSPCNATLLDDDEFCCVCGTEVIREEKFRCPGRRRNGTVCLAILNSTQNFCSKCGWKNDRKSEAVLDVDDQSSSLRGSQAVDNTDKCNSFGDSEDKNTKIAEDKKLELNVDSCQDEISSASIRQTKTNGSDREVQFSNEICASEIKNVNDMLNANIEKTGSIDDFNKTDQKNTKIERDEIEIGQKLENVFDDNVKGIVRTDSKTGSSNDEVAEKKKEAGSSIDNELSKQEKKASSGERGIGKAGIGKKDTGNDEMDKEKDAGIGGKKSDEAGGSVDNEFGKRDKKPSSGERGIGKAGIGKKDTGNDEMDKEKDADIGERKSDEAGGSVDNEFGKRDKKASSGERGIGKAGIGKKDAGNDEMDKEKDAGIGERKSDEAGGSVDNEFGKRDKKASSGERGIGKAGIGKKDAGNDEMDKEKDAGIGGKKSDEAGGSVDNEFGKRDKKASSGERGIGKAGIGKKDAGNDEMDKEKDAGIGERKSDEAGGSVDNEFGKRDKKASSGERGIGKAGIGKKDAGNDEMDKEKDAGIGERKSDEAGGSVDNEFGKRDKKASSGERGIGKAGIGKKDAGNDEMDKEKDAGIGGKKSDEAGGSVDNEFGKRDKKASSGERGNGKAGIGEKDTGNDEMDKEKDAGIGGKKSDEAGGNEFGKRDKKASSGKRGIGKAGIGKKDAGNDEMDKEKDAGIGERKSDEAGGSVDNEFSKREKKASSGERGVGKAGIGKKDTGNDEMDKEKDAGIGERKSDEASKKKEASSNMNINGKTSREEVDICSGAEDKKNGKKDMKSGMRSKNKTSKQKVTEVNFYAILHPKFDLNDFEGIFIKFIASQLPDCKCENENENSRILHAKVLIPACLQREGIFYKYCFKAKNEIIEEKIAGGKQDRRELSFDYLQGFEKGICNQYDGLIYLFEDTGLLKKITDYFKISQKKFNVAEVAEIAAHEYFLMLEGDLQGLGHSKSVLKGDDICKKIMKMVYSLTNCIKYTKYGVPMLFAELILKYLENCSASEGKGDCVKRTALALILVWMVHWYKFHLNCRRFLPYLFLRPNQEDDCFTWDEVKSHFPEFLKNIKQDLLSLCLDCANNGDAVWMFCIPMIHFLEGQVPFTPLKEAKFQCKEWWGTKSLQIVVDTFRKAHKNNWNGILEELKISFVLDPVLPRTVIASLDPSMYRDEIQSGKYPVEAWLANLTHRIKHFPHDYRNLSGKIIDDVQSLRRIIRSNTGSRSTSENLKCLTIANELFQDTVNNSTVDEIVVAVTEVFIEVIENFMSENEKEATDEERNYYTSAVDLLCKWLCKKYFKIKDTFMLWNATIKGGKLEISEIMNEKWKKPLLRSLETELNKLNPFDIGRLFEFCATSQDIDCDIEKTLSRLALDKIEKKMTHEHHSWFYSITEFVNLMSKLFEKRWPETNEDSFILLHILTWTSFRHYVKLSTEPKASELSEKCCRLINVARKLLRKITDHLHNGEIQIECLKLLKNQKECYCDLISLEYEPALKNEIFSVIDMRFKEIEAYMRQKSLIPSLIRLCSHIQIDDSLRHLEEKLDMSVETKPLNFVCKPSMASDSGDSLPVITYFQLPIQLITYLPVLDRFSKSALFVTMWTKTAAAVREETICFDNLVELVLEPTLEKWNKLCDKMKTGNLTYQEFEYYFKNLKNNPHTLMVELETMSSDEDGWIGKRIKEIEMYGFLGNCMKGAELMLKMKSILKLKGCFKPAEIIYKIRDKTGYLKDLNEEMCQKAESMKDITGKDIDCLEVFLKCMNLITWLRENMKDQKELQVFVDLASITAGEGDMEIQKVLCLHSAVTGYAPLIFDLPEDCDFSQLLERCKLVWKTVDNDNNLPKKLQDTNYHSDWLKVVKQSHGSVETNSLLQAEAINDGGIYHVGIRMNEKTVQDLNDIIEVTFPKKKKAKIYSYQQLVDLQSRLMLVAGKAEKVKTEVEKFTLDPLCMLPPDQTEKALPKIRLQQNFNIRMTECRSRLARMFQNITRLASVYLKLCSAGNILFQNWKIVCFCDSKATLGVVIDFGFGDHKLKGHCKKNEYISVLIGRLSNFMEDCLNSWFEHIESKRNKYHVLNYFTTEQLVFLQKEMVKIGQTEPSDLMYPMLANVKTNCKKEDILRAMEKAQKECFAEDDDEGTDLFELDTDPELSELSEERRFLMEMENAGYTQQLALAAIEHVGLDLDEGIAWCMTHMDEEVSEDSADDSKMPCFGWLKQDLLENIVVKFCVDYGSETKLSDPFIENLKELWDHFLKSVSSSFTDFLSVEHLGIILKHLSNYEEKIIERRFPQPLKESCPNLVICPQAEILTLVMSLYMSSNYQPLPMSDEVLYCTEKTSADQLGIFLKRALFDDEKRIYCLVNADRLQYDASCKFEKVLEKYLETHTDYRLVVVCSSENEYRSQIVAALDKYRCPPVTFGTLKGVQTYIQDKLRVKNVTKDSFFASSVDFAGSSVRLIRSEGSGCGKTLLKDRMVEKLKENSNNTTTDVSVTICLHEKEIKMDDFMQVLLKHTLPPDITVPRLFHFDIAHNVQYGVDDLLFNLLILGSLVDSKGHIWCKLPHDIYVIENTPLLIKHASKADPEIAHKILELLPYVTCRSPVESLRILERNIPDYTDIVFDERDFRSMHFQRPYQYLRRLKNTEFDDIDCKNIEGTKEDCLQLLLSHCGVKNPSWAELKNFVKFLNIQLLDFETSIFCDSFLADDLPGFPNFVLRFLIQMSKDFSTRSLNISEESSFLKEQNVTQENDDADLELFQLRRHWESSPHPYLFFNPDHNTMTFLGFNIERKTGNLLDPQTGQILEKSLMSSELQTALFENKVPLNENFDRLERTEKLRKLCQVMGKDYIHDPDETYELTTDNVKKILAIFMRFRCNIPVVVMGETGCGKTRLIRFMCQLQMPPGVQITNMILMKIHGGTTAADIEKKVDAAKELADENALNYGPSVYTVLFFDEANTTEAIGLIKEIVCDGSIMGKKLKRNTNLKFVAACNPYRMQTEEVIKSLEQAGLGYHVDAGNTADRFGHIPMRQLVYRVQPLPPSMLPLVWDFGQLDTDVEELYIRQMVQRYISEENLEDEQVAVISRILSASQEFMRRQGDQCSFVSLRDVERTLLVMDWFYKQGKDGILFQLIAKKKQQKDYEDDYEEDDEEDDDEDEGSIFEEEEELDHLTHSLVLALCVCYHSGLKDRMKYHQHIAPFFTEPHHLPKGAEQILSEIRCCQDVFLENVQLEDNIAHNQALKENVFMMVVCIELRMPLFLVGKPGSSKSLSRTVVADAMQGNAAKSDLFRSLKQAQMVSFQCSPISTPEGILSTFRQCAQFQKDTNLDHFVSAVILDEVGLAEDSTKMPLKTLHPLLEDGCQGDETPEPYKKVAFIGISNWALDPAKMNRGILVQREVPDDSELCESARSICSKKMNVQKEIVPLLNPLAAAYQEVFRKASDEKREFFGLRDFYSLMKMINAFANIGHLTWYKIVYCIKRNFGGLDNVNPLEVFEEKLKQRMNCEFVPGDPDYSTTALIEACLFGNTFANIESRYLLLLMENYSAFGVFQQKISKTCQNVVTVFGSSFPSDQQYTQVCRNINRIKVCMETGNTVILLNLENLYESLYDALNQSYVYLGGDRFVDLGLGTHRVKCRVHQNFRLIVVSVKQTVYNRFPIPLINRLEKHFLTLVSLLTEEQLEYVKELDSWVKDFTTFRFPQRRKRQVQVGFVGFDLDTTAAAVSQVCSEIDDGEQTTQDQVIRRAKELLLWTATPWSILCLSKTNLYLEEEAITDIYFNKQKHNDIFSYLEFHFESHERNQVFVQVTTCSKLLSMADMHRVAAVTKVPLEKIMLLALQSFDTEQQFSCNIRTFFESSKESQNLLIVQCSSGDENNGLIACARNIIHDEQQQHPASKDHVIFIIQLSQINGSQFTGLQTGKWKSVHIDDLQLSVISMPSIVTMKNLSIGDLIIGSLGQDLPNRTFMIQSEAEPMEWDGSDNSFNMSEKNINDASSLDVHKIILQCIQSALSKVKNEGLYYHRTVDRIQILFKLFNESFGKEFPETVSYRVSVLLKEKDEKTSSTITLRSWIQTEAIKEENLNKMLTFRQSLIHCIGEKVHPILAAIIAYVDTNQNLDILLNPSEDDFFAQIWMQLFRDAEATKFNYKHFEELSKNNLNQIIVKNTGYEGRNFSAKIPFSWVIFQQVQVILLEHLKQNEKSENIVSLINIAKKIPAMQILENAFSGCTEENKMELIRGYFNDFVMMVLNCKSENCRKLIFTALEAAIREQNLPTNLIVQCIVSLHFAFSKFSFRLHNLTDIISICPACLDSIMEEINKNALFTNEELTLDVLALQLFLKHLEPDKNQLNRPNGRKEWVKKVLEYRPLIEKVFNSEVQYASLYGEKSKKGLAEARSLWSRVVIVKLFIDHLCPPGMEEASLGVRRCMPLWIMLKNEANLKEVKSLKIVENFLKMCNRDALKYFLKITRECISCKRKHEEAPVKLPCSHFLCVRCFQDAQARNKTCPECVEEIPNNFNPETTEEEKESLDKYNVYKSRCNSFFMDIVSQLCFANDSPPSDEVIVKLLEYITQENRMTTKEISVFDDCIDPTPVVRSFILQLLMQSDEEFVFTHVDRYISEIQTFLAEIQGAHVDKQQEAVCELALLVMHCLEDAYCRGLAGMKTKEIILAADHLRRAQMNMRSDTFTQKMSCLAEIRVGLSVTAKYMNEVLVKKNHENLLDVQHLFDAARAICMDYGLRWPRIFLLKQLVRTYNIQAYYTVANSENFEWIAPPEITQPLFTEAPDYFVVCGEQYTRSRETLTRVLFEENAKYLETIEENEDDLDAFVMIALAFYREITTCSLFPNREKVSQKIFQAITQFSEKSRLLKNEMIIRNILQNSLGEACPQLDVREGLDLQHQGILAMVVHYLIVLQKSRHPILQHLKTLMEQPEDMPHTLFPTMHEDNTEEIREVLLAARNTHTGDHNPVLYSCPNGHIYVVGNCGRPVVTDRCRECNEAIGGHNHVSVAGNKITVGGGDRKLGYTLGSADHRSKQPIPERDLSPACCSILRLFVHMTMFLGANRKPQETSALIRFPLDEKVSEFLWKHILVDLETIRTALGRSTDDLFIMMHVIIHGMHTKLDAEDEAIEVLFHEKPERRNWENQFAKNCLQPVISDLANILNESNQLIHADKQFGSSPLFDLLHEIQSSPKSVSVELLHDSPAVWRYRSQITLEHFVKEFNLKVTGDIDRQFPVLQLFFKMDHHLRALKFIPSILKLQKWLIKRYQKKIGFIEASKMEIHNLFKEIGEGTDFHQLPMLVEDFKQAWECVREAVKTYPCPFVNGQLFVPRELCEQPISNSSSMSTMIPSWSGPGLCSFVLLDFLLRKQNDFMDEYCAITKVSESDLSKVHIDSISAANLIAYDPEKDILPIVLSNCSYTFEIGKGTTIDYNFGEFERQLKDRFFHGKSKIKGGQIETMKFRGDVSNVRIFKDLNDVIEQELLNEAVKYQILREVRSLPSIYSTIDHLEIAASFLVTTGGRKDENLEKFMVDTLQMVGPIASQKAKQFCEFRHIQSLWLLLSHEKEKKLAAASLTQIVFETISNDFKDDLSDAKTVQLKEYLASLNPDQKNLFLEQLFEIITFRISTPQDTNTDDYIDIKTLKLRDLLQAHMEAPLYNDAEMMHLGIEEFPQDIQASAAVSVWLMAHEMLKKI